MTKLKYLGIASIAWLAAGDLPVNQTTINPEILSGDISLNLEEGVWKHWGEDSGFQDIIVDISCDQGICEPEAWGYAYRYHKDVDHQGTVEVLKIEDTWQLKLNLQVQPSPWNPEEKYLAEYYLTLTPENNGLSGTYQGEFGDRQVSGPVKATIHPHWAQSVKNHQPLTPREHPRLIFRHQELPYLRAKSKTETGQKIMAHLRHTLGQEILYDGIAPNGGYHAAGHCFLALIEEDPSKANTAWAIVQQTIANPGPRLLEQSVIVNGVALAYDLCYQFWDEDQISRLTRWLARESVRLINGDTSRRGWNGTPWSNWNARARGAAGLAALAILDEPSSYFPKNAFFEPSGNSDRLVTIARRNIKRYIDTALGDRAFGTEGDLYTRESLHLILPFVQAYQAMFGEDLVSNSSLAWVTPHYLTRMVNQDGTIDLPTYGRHRLGPKGDFFAFGWRTTPQEFLGPLVWGYKNYFNLDSDPTVGLNIYQPHQAIYALVGYPQDIAPVHPQEVLPSVQVDKTKGFFVFRNRWRDENDFVSSIYLKSHPLSASWSYPDVGSFRIWGLGESWAIAGEGEITPAVENVLTLAETEFWQYAQPLFFGAYTDGSGIVTMKTNTITKDGQNLTAIRAFGVDYGQAAGVPGLFVVVDQLIESPDTPATWMMNTAGQVTVAEQAFTIVSESGSTMQGTFVTPDSVEITYVPTENGNRIEATGRGDFFVVMTVQSGKPPELTIDGQGLNAKVKIGRQVISYSRADQALNFLR